MSHMPFISIGLSNINDCMKIRWFLTKLCTKMLEPFYLCTLYTPIH